MPEDLPSPERACEKGQAAQEAQVRSDQAHGALPGEARGRDQGQEGGSTQEQAHREVSPHL